MLSSLDKIHLAVSKFNYPLTLYETSSKIVQEAQTLVDAEYGSIHIKDPNKKDRLKRIYSTLPAEFQLAPRSSGFTYQCFKTGKPLIKHRKDLKSPGYNQLKIKSNILIPLIDQNKTVGVLIVNSSHDRKFTTKEFHLLKIFGSFAIIALRKAQLYENLKKQVDMRDLFISMTAHELRTPLTTINGYIQLLNNKLSKSNSVESKWTYQLYLESQRLTALVDELLQINRIKSGQLQYIFKECKLTEIVLRIIDNFRLVRPERKIIFTNKLGEENDLIIGDFDKLLQVVMNVIENAAKYSPINTTIDVGLLAKEGDLILRIKDQGIGISKKELLKIFEGFYKVDKDSPEGMGLGLFITQNIIKQHRGELKISSQLKQGTTVEIRLPVSQL